MSTLRSESSPGSVRGARVPRPRAQRIVGAFRQTHIGARFMPPVDRTERFRGDTGPENQNLSPAAEPCVCQHHIRRRMGTTRVRDGLAAPVSTLIRFRQKLRFFLPDRRKHASRCIPCWSVPDSVGPTNIPTLSNHRATTIIVAIRVPRQTSRRGGRVFFPAFEVGVILIEADHGDAGRRPGRILVDPQQVPRVGVGPAP